MITLDRIEAFNLFMFHCSNLGVNDLEVTRRLHKSDSCPLTIAIPVNV